MGFKTCSKCALEWDTREEFLADPCVQLNGYQVNFLKLGEGLFLFTHKSPSCGTTLALHARQFIDMHDGPIFENALRGSPECMGLCNRSDSLDPCQAKCECAFVRDVLQRVLGWPKEPVCRSAARAWIKP
jgi:hypothetical protein